MTKFYAIKNTEAKGVYQQNSNFKKKLKEFPNCSHRIFKELDAALSWAGTQGIADAEQQVVLNPAPTKNPKEQKELHHFQTIIDNYKKKGYGLLGLEMNNGKTYFLSLEKTYYYIKEDVSYAFKQDRLYKQIRNGHQQEWVLNTEHLEQNIPKWSINILETSNFEIYGDFLYIEQCCDHTGPGSEINNYKYDNRRSPVRCKKYFHDYKDLTININHIIAVEGRGHWYMDGTVIKDENVLNYLLA